LNSWRWSGRSSALRLASVRSCGGLRGLHECAVRLGRLWRAGLGRVAFWLARILDGAMLGVVALRLANCR
jgi:hypothetical protein